jgi:hypothetical protein
LDDRAEFANSIHCDSDPYRIVSNGDLAELLRAAIGRLPEGIASPAASAAAEPQVPSFTLPHLAEGSFFAGDDRAIRHITGGQAVPITYGGMKLKAGGTMTGRRLAALIGLRDHARRVLQSQDEGWPEEHSTARRLGGH